MDVVFNFIGFTGVACILAAYFLVQTEIISAKSLIFPFINFMGAILLLISLLWTPNIPSIIIEISWIMISLWGIINALLQKPAQAS
tara:strand:- start:152 stop:409 length:258 start_codon:yes stop_codon:yes gene_type:complete